VLEQVSDSLHKKPRLRLATLLAAPILWLVVAYLGALATLLATAFFTIDSFTGNIIQTFTLGNFQDMFSDGAYRNVVVRTLSIAISVTLICTVIGIPMAFYMAKVASRRSQRVLVALVLTPLWASYLVKIYAWRSMLEPGSGVIDWALAPLGIHSPGFGAPAVVIGLTYLWLPYMILPLYAGIERLPDNVLNASSDLGARNWHTFMRVILPLLFPSLVAGSMFTFSLSLGDYITTQIIGGKLQMLGNVVYQNFSINLPFAATISFIPVTIMGIYLYLVRRSGALGNV
jgi:putative spermidine/putrescine transport system permease protein|tara:strand:- start:874 stop:1734 length:861 start_codon:yes stop_codon:yes gene_type:complete